jgi:hypothetical protein
MAMEQHDQGRIRPASLWTSDLPEAFPRHNNQPRPAMGGGGLSLTGTGLELCQADCLRAC